MKGMLQAVTEQDLNRRMMLIRLPAGKDFHSSKMKSSEKQVEELSQIN